MDPTKDSAFQRIFYEKGATVNRMVANHLGWDNWYAALGAHVRSHLWANPTVEDLMRSLAPAFAKASSPAPMNSMLPWLQRPGFPVLTISLVQEQDAESGLSLHVSQQPISKYLPVDRADEPWWVPLQVSIGGGTEFLVQFNTSEVTLDVPASAISALSVGTVQSCVGDPALWGAFIVRYAEQEQWSQRIEAIVSPSGEFSVSHARALAFQSILLATMAHEPVSLPVLVLSRLAPALDQISKIGGYAGTGDIYTFLLTQVPSPLS